MIGAGVSTAVLGLAVFTQIIKPWLRRRRLRQPCKVHFLIRPLQSHRLSYVLQDDQRHDVKAMVLPAHSEVEIEIGYKAKVHFRETEMTFGCDGDEDAKPYATECFVRFVAIGKGHWIPGQDEGHYVDVHRYYHSRRDVFRNVGTHYVTGFKFVTRAPGAYRTYLSFLGDEVEGNAELLILVEDKPHTRMKCVRHWGCYLRPISRVIDNE